MKFTNNKNIPLPIAIWLATNNYEYDTDNRVISATSLLKPLKAIHLARKYRENQKEVDVADLSNLVIGSSIHAGIEEALEPSNIKKVSELLGYNPDKVLEHLVVEKRTKKEINGYVISGQFDMVYKGTVCDVKSTSTWKYILGDGDDYVKQMSIYKWLNPELITSNSGWIFIYLLIGQKLNQEESQTILKIESNPKNTYLMNLLKTISTKRHWL